jgi:hypothetical protein
MDNETNPNTAALADAFYSAVQIVGEYMKECSGMIEGVRVKADTPHRDASIQGLWFRARAWMQSLEALNHTKHFQAISAANRALLEILVDLILLCHDKTNGAGWKIHQWGISERMKAAEQIVEFFADRTLPEEFEPQKTFYKNEKGIVDHFRRNLWPYRKDPSKARHPSRWTGNADLSVDIEAADAAYGAEIRSQLGIGLIEYYRTRYRKMNWQIHSGTAGFWDFPPAAFDLVVAFAFQDCADLAMLSTKIVLTDFGFGQAIPDLSERWKTVADKRVLAYADKMNREPPKKESRIITL